MSPTRQSFLYPYATAHDKKHNTCLPNSILQGPVQCLSSLSITFISQILMPREYWK